MAILEAGSSSDAAPASRGEYDVFLNFRGKDTRHGFTDFLYHGLNDVGIRVFRDEEELPVGEVISEKLQEAIKNTIIYIPIFSQTYASSKWCLRELALMVDNVSESKDQKSILPIFFHVEPDDVKLKKPLYEADIKKHEEDFRDEVEAWKGALRKVDERKGWVVKPDQSQAAIVKSIVKEVLEKLKIKQKLVTGHLIGLDDRIKDLKKLLDVNNDDDVRLIGIYGMGGIGKTTIAMVIFNQLCSYFGKCCSFLEGVRERSTKEGIVPLQKKLLYDIGGSGSIGEINDSEEGMRRIGATLANKKVLVVLDDVDKKVPIKNLIGNFELYQGSRIIITTRDTSVLIVEGFKGETQLYEMLKMDVDNALQLFSRHAFSGDFPSDDYRRLSGDVVSSTGGLPLAIEVIGSLLNGKDQEIWEETLEKLRKVPEKKILETLRISYDDLDKHHKQIFLDIACFFFNENKSDAIFMWTDCQFYPKGGIKVLTDRCMVKILDNDKFWMHDQLIALGRQIVREDSLDDLGKQSRLWIAEEALQIISTEERKDKVQALSVMIPEITNEDFERFPNLRLLELRHGTYAGDFAKCHSNLRWFSWSSSPEKDFRADNLYLNQLVVCKLHEINFKDNSKAWDLIKRAWNLKVLSFNLCLGIKTIPNISKCLRLERLTLEKCPELERIESFIGNLQSLIELKIEECRNLTKLPEEIGALVKLKHFSLSRCSRLRELPGSIGNLTSLTELDLSDTIIRKLPNSIGKLKSLRILHFRVNSLDDRENYDLQLPSSIRTLVNLEELDLSRHYDMKGEFHVGIGELSSLRILNLESTGICRIPRTINMLHHLQTLNLSYCHEIQELPELPTSLTCLLLISESLLSVPNLSNLTNLVVLQLSDYSIVTKKPNLITVCNLRLIGRLSRLQMLKLDLLNVPAPLELASLSHLKELDLRHLDLKPLEQLPSPDSSWRNLSTLEISCCKAKDISLEGLSQLERFTVESCIRFQRLSIPSKLRKLRIVEVSWCPELVDIQVVGLSKSLEYFFVFGCESLRKIGGLSYLKNLETLGIEYCHVLTNVEGLDELESLKYLKVRECKSLRRLIDAYCTNIPDDCALMTTECGYPIKDCRRRKPLKRYREGVLLNTLDKIKHPFTIIFVLGVKKYSEGFGFVGGIEWEIENVIPSSVTYEGLIADVKGFGFRLERLWYKAPGEDCVLLIEITSDEQVNGMVPLASTRGFVHLYVEGGFESEPSNAECSEATGNRKQTRDERTGHDGIVDGGKTVSMENRNKDKDMIGEPANKK